MSAVNGFERRWEVRPALHLPGYRDETEMDGVIAATRSIQASLRKQTNVALAHVGLVLGEQAVSVSATIVLAQPSNPGTAVDEVTTLLAQACRDVGLTTDAITEITVVPADVDPRSL